MCVESESHRIVWSECPDEEVEQGVLIRVAGTKSPAGVHVSHLMRDCLQHGQNVNEWEEKTLQDQMSRQG